MSLTIDWLPRNRRPTHPGHVLRLDVLLGITRHRSSEIHHGKRSVTPDTARVLGTGPEVWLGMQHALDLWDALRPLKRSVA